MYFGGFKDFAYSKFKNYYYLEEYFKMNNFRFLSIIDFYFKILINLLALNYQNPFYII
jgi:hypothetical protein